MTNYRWKIAQAAEIRWWQNYLKKKPIGDYLTWKKNYWTQFLNNINIHPSPTENLLDVGCGPAGSFLVLTENPLDAVDPLLDSYQEKIPHFDSSHYPNTTFHSLPFEQYHTIKKYDTILCLNAINHVADLHHCFDKLVELTKPGGTLVVSIDAHNYSFFKRIFRLLPGDILHPHQYDLAEYQAMLTSRNCTLQQSLLVDKQFFFDYYVLVARKN